MRYKIKKALFDRGIFVLVIMVVGMINSTFAQLPDCVNNPNVVYILSSSNAIVNWNTDIFPTIDTTFNSIVAPFNGGLAVCDRLPERDYKTFYFVDGNTPANYHYYDGTNWVNTGHYASPLASNIAGAGQYIYNLNGLSGTVYRYDGTGNDTAVLSLSLWGGPFDLAGDMDGNFYILKTNSTANTPRWLRKYDPNGNLLQQWQLIGGGTSVPGQSNGGCMAIVCRDVFFHNGQKLYHGVMDSDTITFAEYGYSEVGGLDYGSCDMYLKTKIIDTTVCHNQLPFTWNEQMIEQEGTYQHTISDETFGCDSLVVLNVTLLSQFQTHTDSIICQSELPFSWNSYYITESGTYLLSDTVQTAGYCDSITQINLTIIPTKNVSIDTAICGYDLPFIWQNKTVVDVGNFILRDTFISENACDSIVNLNLFVRQTTVKIDTFLCHNQLPFTWNNQLIDQWGNYSHTTSNSAECDSITELHLHLKCEITIPNVLVLSSQQGNNAWFVDDVGFQEYHCQIINRWGIVVFESKESHEKWTGIDENGAKVTNGVYFYTIKGIYGDGTSIQKNGFITVTE